MLRYVLGNTKPALRFKIERDGDAEDLTGCTVQFRLKKPDGNIVTKTLSIENPATAGIVTLSAFSAGDIDQTGEMWAELEVIYPDGSVQSSEEPIQVVVRAKFIEAAQ